MKPLLYPHHDSEGQASSATWGSAHGSSFCFILHLPGLGPLPVVQALCSYFCLIDMLWTHFLALAP